MIDSVTWFAINEGLQALIADSQTDTLGLVLQLFTKSPETPPAVLQHLQKAYVCSTMAQRVKRVPLT